MGKGYLASFTLVIALLFITATATPLAMASLCDPLSADKRGCCSHHNGVCGCNQVTGMQRCCDGTDSPSYRCGE